MLGGWGFEGFAGAGFRQGVGPSLRTRVAGKGPVGMWRVGPRLGLASGDLGVRRVRPGTLAGSLGPEWVVETLACLLPILLSPEGLSLFLPISSP